MVLYVLNSFYAVCHIFPSALRKRYSENKDVGKHSKDWLRVATSARVGHQLQVHSSFASSV